MVRAELARRVSGYLPRRARVWPSVIARRAARLKLWCASAARTIALRLRLNWITSASAQALVAAAVEHYGRLDALVVNHGIAPDELPVDQMTDARWRHTMAVNLDSAFALVRSAVAQMKAQKGPGRIVLISSASGQRGEARLCDYGASKGAIISLTKSLAAELASFGIYVNCVAPGWVNTDMAAPYLTDPALREGILRTIPLRRVGTPEEIAAPVLFLCTPHAGFMTGEIMNVNGGSAMVG